MCTCSVSSFRFDEKFSGSMGEIFEVIAKNLNITYDAVKSIDGFYGSKVNKLISIKKDMAKHKYKTV